MKRRTFLASTIASLAVLAARPRLAAAQPTNDSRTNWRVSSSEGLDAIAFLGPLSGGDLYTRYYADDLAEIVPRLPSWLPSDVEALYQEARDVGFGLFAPGLSVIYSVDDAHRSLASLIEATQRRDTFLLPAYRTSPYWDEKDWAWFDANAKRLERIFKALADADFAKFRAERIGNIDRRISEVAGALTRYDVVKWQEKLTGRPFDPTINIVLLQFSKPHGIKVQGQTFLQAADYDTATTVRIAAHEMLHPPVDMDGPAAKAAMNVLGADPLMMKIVKEHDPKWGYTTLQGLLDEDLTEALDQLISEALGVAKNPADRWNKADDGIHVMAAGFYGLLRQERWVETGGSIEKWLLDAANGSRFAPKNFHPIAARVLERDVNRLWPLA